MIAPAYLPASFVVWNAMTGASHAGPFGMYRPYPSTRAWEYPWAWFAVPVKAGSRALDVGGALCGFSLTLARAGVDVLVVDPDTDGQSPAFLLDRHAATFGVTVRSFRGEVCDVPEAAGSYDIAYCLSVVEHIPTIEARARLMQGVHRLLRPGGHFVLTVDLALHFHPFTERRGPPELQNVSFAELLSHAPFELESGLPSDLIGMPGFDSAQILSRARKGELLQDGNRLSTQCVVLRA